MLQNGRIGAHKLSPFTQINGKKHIWNPRPHFAYSLFNFYGATMTIKGSLLVSVPIVKQFFRTAHAQYPYLVSPTPLCLFTIFGR